MGEVVPACTSPTLHPPILSRCASIVVTITLRVKKRNSLTPGCIPRIILHHVFSHQWKEHGEFCCNLVLFLYTFSLSSFVRSTIS